MFIDNKYTKWYYAIIDKSRNRVNDEYVEEHHIIPKALGGNNTKTNRIKLTAREHFICHLLLVKMVRGKNKSKMAWALHRMTFTKNKHHQRKFNSYQYNIVRKIHANNMRQNNPMKRPNIRKMFIGKNNSMYGKQRFDLIEYNKTKIRNWKLISPKNEIINISNLAQFCQNNNLHKGAMSEVAMGKRNHYKGWLCEKVAA